MKKKIIALLVGIGMIVGGLPSIVTLAQDSSNTLRRLESGSHDLVKPSIAEIQAKYKTITKATEIYEVEPTFNPYFLGELHESFLASGLTSVNYMRYIAGVPQVKLDKGLNKQAQYAAIVLARNNLLSHTPDQPEDMDITFYSYAYYAAAKSNLTLYESDQAFTKQDKLTRQISATQDYMEDYYLYELGHRFWLINAPMFYTGFGYMDASRYSNIQTMYVANQYNKGYVNYDFVAWPASGYMPSDIFSNLEAWSLSLNPAIYGTTQNSENIRITLTRLSDKKQFVFDKVSFEDVPSARKDTKPYFIVQSDSEEDSYGEGVEIIFYPGADFFEGSVGSKKGTPIYGTDANPIYAKSLNGVFEVAVRGITDKNGNDASFCYRVGFFDRENGILQNANLLQLTEAALSTNDTPTLDSMDTEESETATIIPSNPTNDSVAVPVNATQMQVPDTTTAPETSTTETQVPPTTSAPVISPSTPSEITDDATLAVSASQSVNAVEDETEESVPISSTELLQVPIPTQKQEQETVQNTSQKTNATKIPVATRLNILLNGNTLDLNDNVWVEEERLFLPVRTIAEVFNLEVGYNAASKVAILVKENTTLEFALGSNIAVINGEKIVQIDQENANVKIISSNDRIYLPVRFIAEYLDIQINYSNQVVSFTVSH